MLRMVHGAEAMGKSGGGSAAKPDLRRVLLKRSKEVLRQRRRVRRRGDPDSVHDLRVATRRLQEALDFFAPLLPERPRHRLARRARRIRRSLGEVRNADVMVALLRDLDRTLPPRERPRLQRLAGRLEAEARALRRPAAGRHGLPVPGIRRRSAALLEQVRKGRRSPASTGDPGRGRGLRVVWDRLRQVERALPAARTGDAEALHALRIAVKKHRYALEILAETGFGKVRPAIRAARALQAGLGHLHDLDVLIGRVRRSSGPGAGRALLARLLQERRRAATGVLAALARFRPAAGGEAAVASLPARAPAREPGRAAPRRRSGRSGRFTTSRALPAGAHAAEAIR